MKMSSISIMLNYGKRICKILPDFILGTGSETVGKALRETNGSIWTKIKASGSALEKEKATYKDGFFKRMGKELVNTPKELKTNIKAEVSATKANNIKVLKEAIKKAKAEMPKASRKEILAAAKATLKKGTSSTGKAALKGISKTLGKKIPVIGAVITIAWEAPNILKAFKKDGFWSGMKEVGGAGVELGCVAAGAAIGSAIPGLGTLVGGIIGGIVGCIGGALLRGRTFSDKLDFLTAAGLTNEDMEQYKKAGYSYDDMVKITEAQLAEAEKQQQSLEQSQAQSLLAQNSEEDNATQAGLEKSQTARTATEQTTRKEKEGKEGSYTFTPLEYQTYFGFNNNNTYTFSGQQSNPFSATNYNYANTYNNPFFMNSYNSMYNGTSIFGNGMYNTQNIENYLNNLYGQTVLKGQSA